MHAELHPTAALAPIAPPKLRPQLPALPKPLSQHERGSVGGAKLATHYSGWADLLARMLVLQGVRIVPPPNGPGCLSAPAQPLHVPRGAALGHMDWDADGCELARYLCYAGILQVGGWVGGRVYSSGPWLTLWQVHVPYKRASPFALQLLLLLAAGCAPYARMHASCV